MSESTWSTLVDAHQSSTVDLSASQLDNVPVHEPKAAVLACSDARVPPSVVFDQPAGSLFVTRIAGNTAPASVLASLDYAVETLGVNLIVVLGHTSCGAVQAAASGTCGGHLAPIVGPICSIAQRSPAATPDEIAEMNVANTVDVLMTHDGPIGLEARSGRLEIQGAIHDLRTGRLLRVEMSQKAQPVR